MNMYSVYIPDGISVAILLILFYVARTKFLRNRMEDKLYSYLVLGIMLGSITDMLSFAIDGKVFWGSRVLNYIANTYLFSANMLLPFFLLVYVDLCLYGDPGRITKKYKVHIIVGAIFIALNIVNYFIPLTYYISEQNVYERKPWSYLYYAVIVFYCVSIIVALFRYEKEYGARSFLNFYMFLIPVIVGVGLQFLFYGLSLAWLSSAIGLGGLFMMQQNEVAYIDSLVDTYNRQYLDHVLSAWISRSRNFAGVMIDIDRFKSINDNFGHSEGDKALKTVADILKQSARDREWVFRFAGDEFIVLKQTDSPEQLEEYIKRVNTMTAVYNSGDNLYKLSLSYGISYFNKRDIDTFMKEMDERMYEMKLAHHKAENTH